MKKTQSIFAILILIVLSITVAALVFLTSAKDKSSIQPGDTITTGTYSENICNEYSDPCDGISITTEIDVKEIDNERLTGEFFVRAYKNGSLLSEQLLAANFNPFAGDGGQDIEEIATNERLLSIEKSNPEEKFSLDYVDDVPGWDIAGYVLNLKTLDKASDQDGRLIEFYYQAGFLTISFPM